MIDILSTKIENMPGVSFDCSCGRNHSVKIDKLVVGNGILDELAGDLESYRGTNIFVLSDRNTYGVLGEAVVERLRQDGYKFKSFVFDTGDHALLPDESAVGRVLLELEPDTSFILAVGSGVINDIARIVSFRTGKSFAIAGFTGAPRGWLCIGRIVTDYWQKKNNCLQPLSMCYLCRYLCYAQCSDDNDTGWVWRRAG
jgi:glycerol-1-phosphate dehydrogenase [NAD(P)+]